MNSTSLRISTALLTACLATAAAAQSNVTNTNKFAWGENIGWLNFRDAGNPAGTQGARIGVRTLSGFVWSENTGYINLGSGSPANGSQYANTSGTDFGVNRDANTGALSGLAWSENLGWINFGPWSGGSTATAPKALANRLSGYAWSENAGWINLDLTASGLFVAYTAKCSLADVAGLGGTVGGDGQLSADDVVVFLGAFFAGNMSIADIAVLGGQAGQDAQLTADDIVLFLSTFFAGCN
jgi:hypothetical protein